LNQDSMLELRENFPLDLAEVESAVVAHKFYNGVKLPVYEVSVVADYCHTDDSTGFAVLTANFGN